VSAPQVVYPTYEELLHQLRKARSEISGLQYALDERVEQFGEDAEKAERAQSRLWFHAWKESQRQNRALREEIARMKEGRGG
jgi:rhamnogalacturonyl hydrolase YesR